MSTGARLEVNYVPSVKEAIETNRNFVQFERTTHSALLQPLKKFYNRKNTKMTELSNFTLCTVMRYGHDRCNMDRD